MSISKENLENSKELICLFFVQALTDLSELIIKYPLCTDVLKFSHFISQNMHEFNILWSRKKKHKEGLERFTLFYKNYPIFKDSLRFSKIISCNDAYNQVIEREKHARTTWGNAAQMALKFAKDWPEELRILIMGVGDVSDHLEFAVSILEGEPRKIDEKTLIDTASRDEIPHDVWHWYLNDFRDGTYKKDELGALSRKEKKSLLVKIPLSIQKNSKIKKKI